MSEQATVDWMDWLLKDPTVDLESELGQELVRCIGQFDLTKHPSFVDMAVLRSFQLSGALPETILQLSVFQAKARLMEGPKGYLSKALRAEARKMKLTTMTALVAAGLDDQTASLRTAEALNKIYGKQPYADSTIRRAYLKYQKSGEGKLLLDTLKADFSKHPDRRQKLLDEVSELKPLASGVYN